MFKSPYQHQHFSEIDSTNAYAKRLPFDTASDYLIITADRQTAGYGRNNKKWESGTVDNIACTLVFLNPAQPIQCYNEAISLAIAETLSQYQTNVVIKWPNDILQETKKIAGILVEVQYVGSDIKLVIGFGINCSIKGIDESLLYKVTHIFSDVNKQHVIAEIITKFEDLMHNTDSELRHQNYIEELQWMLNKQIHFEEKLYRIIGFTEKNAIIITDDIGNEKIVYAGEISLQNFYHNIKIEE